MNGNDLKYSLVVLLFIFLVELLMFTLCFEHLSSPLNISLVLNFSVWPDPHRLCRKHVWDLKACDYFSMIRCTIFTWWAKKPCTMAISMFLDKPQQRLRTLSAVSVPETFFAFIFSIGILKNIFSIKLKLRHKQTKSIKKTKGPYLKAFIFWNEPHSAWSIMKDDCVYFKIDFPR